jgi:hypothetical protein
LRCRDLVDCRHAEGADPLTREFGSLVEAYLTAERDLVTAVDAAGGAVPLPDGRAITTGAEFDALLGQRRKRARIIIRKKTPMPARR